MKIVQILILSMCLFTACNHAHYHENAYSSQDEKDTVSEIVSTFPTVGYKVVHKDTIPYAVAKVFPLLEPKGRKLLYENWDPIELKKGEEGTLKGLMLYSKYDEMDVTLTVTQYNPEKGHIQYLVIWDDFEIQRIDIFCVKGTTENSSIIKWVEHNAGLYEKGIPLVKMFIEEGYCIKAVDRYLNNIQNQLQDGK
ncbi:hypothetical protein EI427_00460 [Flammeovirga pectinis]|uniref:SRPBCC family protein n=1 Tax=Flammeovirga pectinis TaxID=2494373 RepID=A0A3S9NXQ4_9BACT|nr:hypothetical protein [Flammeovirga pectinis]AZQ60732.1 hypothetical protein EI427_00460 [Flammeovirga pectinis]